MSTTPEEYAEWAEEDARQEQAAETVRAARVARECAARRFVRLLPRYPGEGNRKARRAAAKGRVRK